MAERLCLHCGTASTTLLRCSSCKEANYCNKEHSKEDWKQHKATCLYVKENPKCIFIEVQPGEGSGIGNHHTTHTFDNKEEGLEFVKRQFGGRMSRPLRSEFCEFLGWRVEIYCSTVGNQVLPPGSMMEVVGNRRQGLNSAGIYLGCSIASGLTVYNNLDGKIFVTGRRISDGKALASGSLWGISNFIWDAMDLYDGTIACNNPEAVLTKWAQRYREGTWSARGGNAGIDVYEVGP